MKKHPIWYLIIGIFILIVPTVIYLCFLIPQMSERYIVLMSSGGVIGGAGFYGAESIPRGLKGEKIYKLAAKSFTLFTVITLVNEFIMQIIGCVALFVVCYIVFIILKGVWKNARRKLENAELSEEITRNITKIIK